MTITIDKAAFDSWLTQQPPDKVMGRGACECPIAEYLKGQGFKQVSVSCNAVWTMQSGYTSMPDWVNRFIYRYDEWVEAHGHVGPEYTRFLLNTIMV